MPKVTDQYKFELNQTYQTNESRAEQTLPKQSYIKPEETKAQSDPRHKKFYLLVCGLSAGLGMALSALFMMLVQNSTKDMVMLLAGSIIGGANLGLAASIVLWHYLKSGRAMKLPLAISNLFILALILPFSVAIGSCLFFLFSSDPFLTWHTLLRLPFEVLREYYYMPLALLPVAAAIWLLQLFAVNRYFGDFMPAFAGAAGEGRFSVRQRTTALRCDICHQDDEFMIKTGFCKRCQRYTF